MSSEAVEQLNANLETTRIVDGKVLEEGEPLSREGDDQDDMAPKKELTVI